MSEKAKMDKPSRPRINRYGFLALWVGGQIIGWLVLYLALESETRFGSFLGELITTSNWFVAPLITILVGIPTILVQKLALYLGFGRSFRGWTRANLVGWFLGSFAFVALLSRGIDGNGRYELVLQILTLMLLPTIAQALVLSRYVKRAWLWLLATVAASTVFSAAAQQFVNGDWGIYVSFGAYAVVTGLTLLWLFGMQATENQVKQVLDTSRLEDKAENEHEASETMEIEAEQAQ